MAVTVLSEQLVKLIWCQLNNGHALASGTIHSATPVVIVAQCHGEFGEGWCVIFFSTFMSIGLYRLSKGSVVTEEGQEGNLP